jgi:hypothetical protein
MSKLSKTAIHRGAKNSDVIDAKFHRSNSHTEVRKARYLKRKNLL